MAVSIRPRTPADLDACVAALRAVHEADHYPLNWPADPVRWLTPPSLVAAWVAALDDLPVAGHVAVLDSGELELARLFVPPAARRRSVASALLKAVTDWAPAPLTLNVTDEERSAAVALYEAAGWRYTRSTTAPWTAPDGSAVTLRHYTQDRIST